MSYDVWNASPILLIVDVQRGFINEYTRHIIARIERLQHQYSHVIATRFYNPNPSPYRNLLDWHEVARDDSSFELAFCPKEGIILWDKPTYGFLNGERLAYLLHHQPSVVDICGIETDICVTQCAVELFEAGFIPRVLASYCASCSGHDAHVCALKTLEKYIGKRQVIMSSLEDR